MGVRSEDSVKQVRAMVDEADEVLHKTFKNIHQGYPDETVVRFLKARDWNVSKAYKMLMDCLRWRIENEIDTILAKPIVPMDLYRAIRDTHLTGLSGYSNAGLPVFAFGVGLSTFDKASVHYYVQSHIQLNEYRDRVVLPNATKLQGRYVGTCVKVMDMTGLKLSSLSLIKLLTTISTVDDLNYPEKTDAYFIVNASYAFSACWKVINHATKSGKVVHLNCFEYIFSNWNLLHFHSTNTNTKVGQAVKPLLQERTRRKVQVLPGCGREELLKIMDHSALPHFCKRERSGLSRHSSYEVEDCCYSVDHTFHQNMYSYIKYQARLGGLPAPTKQGSFHVDVPPPDIDDKKIAQILGDQFHKYGEKNGISQSMNGLTINGA